MKRSLLIILSLISCAAAIGQYKMESIFSEGTFYKISVETNGIHKLDKSFFAALPHDGSLNPKTISLFGNRGGVLPELIASPRIDDVEELPMLWVGNDDQNFDDNEYFLFYAEGPDLLSYDDGKFRAPKNPYETKNFYFVSMTKASSKQIVDRDYGNSSTSATTYDDFQKYEKDLVNLLGKNFGTQGTGKVWYGEEFSNDRVQQFTDRFDIANIVDGSDVTFNLRFANRSPRSSTGVLRANNVTRSSVASSVNIFSGYAVYARARNIELVMPFNTNQGLEKLEVEMIANDATFSSWIDYITMQAEKKLIYGGESFNFRKLGTSDYSYSISSPSQIEVWNVSDPINVIRPNQNYGSNQLTFVAPGNQEFVAFSRDENFKKPTFEKTISTQNLHNIIDAEYVIIYHENFEESAKRLGEHRSNMEGLTTYVIDVDQVFNEFAGGSKDPVAIRDFARMLYRRSGTFKYLCLFGDATYDYRGIDPTLSSDNYVPCYQTNSELSPTTGFPSDDFFALLSDNEGGNLKGAIEIGVGRIPVGSVQEAKTVVDKLINYDTKIDFNREWKNNFILLADDEDHNTHLNQTEGLADIITEDRPEFNLKKVYFDGFEQVSTTGDARYPDAKKKFNDYMYQGALLVNYFGHGGPNGLGQERVVDIQDILGWKNENRLPFFISATCTFTGFDDAGVKSGGELTFLNPQGGSIGLMSTVRAVTISPNERLVRALMEFLYEKEDGKYLRMGDIVRMAKNLNRSDTVDINARKFALFGDPAFRLAIPNNTARVTSFQQNPVNTVNDTIRALDEVNIEGDIVDGNGNFLSTYNGKIEITVFDKAKTLTTLANDERSLEKDYKSYDAVIYKGSASVENGRFAISFRVPEDIDYRYGKGRISLYAYNDVMGQDASGYYDDFWIGGTSNNPIQDNTPPTITLLLNNDFFQSGDVVGPDPVMIAKVNDDYGINLSNTAIGHEMIGILDEDLPNQIILNDFYRGTSSTSGEIVYPFNNLEDGTHTLTVRVWDIANNPAEATITFIVERGRINVLENVKVWPNPSPNDVEFSFTHQLSYVPVNVRIDIFDNLGRRVAEVNESITTGGNAIENIVWNGQGYGGRVPSGMYYYKISASASSATGETETAESSGGRIIIVD